MCVHYLCLVPTKVKDQCLILCEPTGRRWKLSLDLLQEQQVLLNFDPALQPTSFPLYSTL